MSIRKRIILIFFSTMVPAILLINIAFGLFFQNYILRQEQQEILLKHEILSTYLSQKENAYLGSVNDWAHWDDTYQYIINRNPDYITANFQTDTFVNLDLSFAVFVNESSQIINKYYYDFTIDSLTEFPSHFTEDFESIVQLPVFDGDTYGIHKIGSNYYFLAASGVTDSNKQNKTNSTMIFGRIIDQSMIESIESTSGCSVTLSAVELSTENILQTETAQFKP